MSVPDGRQGEPGRHVSAGAEQVCITCSDQAVPMRVVEFLGAGMARVDTGVWTEDICIDLVEAAVGDTLLVHAKVAIGKM